MDNMKVLWASAALISSGGHQCRSGKLLGGDHSTMRATRKVFPPVKLMFLCTKYQSLIRYNKARSRKNIKLIQNNIKK